MTKKRTDRLNSLKKSAFTSREAMLCGLTNYDLKKLVNEGLIIKEGRGVYLKEANSREYETSQYAVVLAQLGAPSAICLWTALTFHDLTEEVPSIIWAYVPYEKSSHLKSVKIVRKRNPFWEIGIETINGIKITNIERTLVDAMADRKHFTKAQSFIMILSAIKDQKTTLMKIMNMAKKLKVINRLGQDLLLLQDAYV
jgi:predicted transcriptional regulator of viral defense system